MLEKIQASTKTTYLIALLVTLTYYFGMAYEEGFMAIRIVRALVLIFLLHLEFKNYLPNRKKTFFRYFLHGLKLLIFGYLIGWVLIFLITTISELNGFHLLDTALMLFPMLIADVLLTFPFLLIGLLVLSVIYGNKGGGDTTDILDSSEVNH